MQSLLRSSIALLLTTAVPAIATAERWTAPDGLLSVTRPDPAQFEEIRPPPHPFLVLWASQDETIRLGIMKTEMPADLKLIQSSAEKGLAEELNGSVTRLPSKQISGYEVWNMVAKNDTMEVTQAMLRRGSDLYKLMAVAPAGSDDRASIDSFFDSLAIAEPTAGSFGAHRPRASGDQRDGHNLSKKIGGASLLLLIALGVYWYMRRRH